MCRHKPVRRRASTTCTCHYSHVLARVLAEVRTQPSLRVWVASHSEKKKVMEGLLMRIGRCSTLYGQSGPSRALQSCHTKLGGWLWVGEWNYDIRGRLTVKRSSHVTQWKVKKLVERIACKKQVKELSKSNEKYRAMQIWLTHETLSWNILLSSILLIDGQANSLTTLKNFFPSWWLSI